MSASTEKKNRRAAREAGTDKKTKAAQEEAKKQARSKRRWTLGTAVALVLLALVLLVNSSLPYIVTTAVSIGGEKYSPARLSYAYANQYLTFANQYGSYASLFGLDTSGGLGGLRTQTCPMTESGTWRDYFLDAAQNDLLQITALKDYARQRDITLTQEEEDEALTSLADIDATAESLGYSSTRAFLTANYGKGVSLDLIRQALLDSALANKTYTDMSDSREYTQEQLDAYYDGLNGAEDLFDYAYYYAAAATEDVTGEDGATSSAPTDETRAQARELAEAIVASYKELAAQAGDGADYGALLDEAVAANVEGGAATHPSQTAGGSLGDYSEFLMDAGRKIGDADTVANSSDTGTYAVVFLGREDNTYHLANVRHILVMAEASEDGTYSDEALEAARTRAEEILAEWKAGEATEDSFAQLAIQYSEDTGSVANGGLYENIRKGDMVEEFNDFCFAGHKSGDTGIVYGSNDSYAGYHVIYYVGDGDLCRDYIAREALVSEDMTSWLAELTSVYTVEPGFGLRFVG